MYYTRPQQSANHGFTIVETMIVLAVAGLMLLVVMLAIPALQRNSRNNQRRQDIQIILQDVSNYELNNSGNVPDTSQLQAFLTKYERNKITYYPIANIHSTIQTIPTRTDKAAVTDLDTVQVYNYEKCSTTVAGAATIAGAGYNDVAALFAIETTSGASSQCQQL